MLIQEKMEHRTLPVLWSLGFRPFFLLASLFSLISMFVWGVVYVYGWSAPSLVFSPLHWHAHEMIFGYGMAVAAGFLLTAVRNWTRLDTIHGYPLAGLTALWLAARLAGMSGWPMALPDLLFDSWLIVAIFTPILRAKQYQQIGIASKLVLLMLANLCFYLGASGMLEQGIVWGLHTGLYVLLALIFSMARRVLPFFIEQGVGYSVKLKNSLWVDRFAIYAFILFVVADVFMHNVAVAAVLAGSLFVIHVLRLAGWHTKGIWKKPLLWVLYLGYAGATFGFFLKMLEPFMSLPPFLALHAFAVGGVGMIAMGMMARVSLAHTGRNIQRYSKLLLPMFVLMIAAYVARVLLPMMAPRHYLLWLAVAQALWLIAFALFVLVYGPILAKPEADGMSG